MSSRFNPQRRKYNLKKLARYLLSKMSPVQLVQMESKWGQAKGKLKSNKKNESLLISGPPLQASNGGAYYEGLDASNKECQALQPSSSDCFTKLSVIDVLDKNIKLDDIFNQPKSKKSKNEKDLNNSDTPVSYSALNKVLSDVKSHGAINLDDSEYSNIPISIFRDQGWKYHSKLDTDPGFFFQAFTQENESFSMTQISMVDVIAQFNGEPVSYALQIQVHHGLVLEYNKQTDELSVFYYDAGLVFEELQLGINKLEGRNIFYTNWVGGVLEQEPDYVKGVAATVPYADTAYSLWNSFNTTHTQQLNTEKEYDKTFKLQSQRNGGDVIRGIKGDYSSYTMQAEGQWARIKGKIQTETSTISLSYSYQYKAKSSF